MKRTMACKMFSVFVSIAFAMAFAFPTTALAAQPEVQVENHTVAGVQTVSKISIDGVDAPIAGKPLDDKATVSTAEGATWDIPVLWIGDDLRLATEAVEGRTYLPALAFFVPQEYAVEGDNFTVTLSSSLTKLFGDENAISVYDSRTGITYILPISLRDFFTLAANEASRANETSVASETSIATEQEETDPSGEYGDGDNYPARTNVEIWCAQTARDALSDQDLEYLIDLVLHTLEPQAVNLLADSFPAFKAAAAQDQIGKQIGLYIYYKTGDKDGKPEHESASEALAYVSGDSVNMDGEIKYCYMIGIDVDDLLVKQNDEPVKNEETGKFTLDRNGEGTVTFNNTIVHEMFHAFMDDYNRTGMLGAKTAVDGYTPGNKFVNDEQHANFSALRYPSWFIEGTASAVENVYQFRYNSFEMLRAKEGSSTVFEDTYTLGTLLYNYLNAQTADGEDLNFELGYASNQTNYVQARYVTGYIATLYLAQLAAQKDPAIGSAVSNHDAFSSEKLRLGLNTILKRMHEGETLDQVIRDISTIDGAAPLYNDANDFENKFIKGVEDENKLYHGDYASSQFTLDFLNYMLSLENTQGRKYKPNGSILFDFSEDYNVPIDESKQSESDFFIIVTSNEYVESTVPDSVAFASGGKSDLPNKSTSASLATAATVDEELPLAAKAEAEPSIAEGQTEPEPGSDIDHSGNLEVA